MVVAGRAGRSRRILADKSPKTWYEPKGTSLLDAQAGAHNSAIAIAGLVLGTFFLLQVPVQKYDLQLLVILAILLAVFHAPLVWPLQRLIVARR